MVCELRWSGGSRAAEVTERHGRGLIPLAMEEAHQLGLVVSRETEPAADG